VGKLEIRNAIIVLEWEGQRFRIPLALKLTYQSNDLFHGILHTFPRTQEITTVFDLDLHAKTAHLNVDANAIHFERFSDLTGRIPGLNVSGELDIAGEAQLRFKPFQISSLQASCEFRNNNSGYYSFKLRNFRKSLTENTSIRMMVRSVDGKKWHISVSSAELNSPVPLRISRMNALFRGYQENLKCSGDLLLELDDAVIAIENKLFAIFQPNQPHKYLPTLDKIVKGLSGIRRSEIRYSVFVLCPASRTEEARKRIGSIDKSAVVTWEALISDLKKIDSISDPTARVVLDELLDYLNSQIGFIPDFANWAPHLRRHFEPTGTALQRNVVGRLWSFFPNAGKRLGFGDTWVGYYFLEGQSGHRGWYGFVANSELEEKDTHPAELIVVSTYKPKHLSSAFEEVKLVNKNWIGRPKETTAWIIDFDDTWITSQKWSVEISPFSEAITDLEQSPNTSQ